MKCKNCGQELSDDMKFCTNCGCPVEKTIQPAAFILSTTNSIPTYKIIDCYGAIYASSSSFVSLLDNPASSIGNYIGLFKGGHDSDMGSVLIYESHYKCVTERIIEKAQENGCNAIIGLRYQVHNANDRFYLTAYGTACVIEKEKQ